MCNTTACKLPAGIAMQNPNIHMCTTVFLSNERKESHMCSDLL